MCGSIKYCLYYFLTCICILSCINYSCVFVEKISAIQFQEDCVLPVLVTYAFFYIILYLLDSKVKKDSFKFYSLLLFSIFSICCMTYCTNGTILKNLLFDDPNDTFMDFFNCLYLGNNPYSVSPIEGFPPIAVYPPLSIIGFNILGNMINPNSDLFWHDIALHTRNSQIGMMVFGLYTLGLYSSIILVWSLIKQGGIYEKACFCFVMIFSLPFIFMFERGNNIMVALLFLLCFINLYTSNNRVARYFSFFCLAIATTIKISPIIFSLLLLRERRYKEFLLAIFITIIVLIVPFFYFYGGLREQFLQLINNISLNSIFYSNKLFPTYFIDVRKLLSFFFPGIMPDLIKWSMVICGVCLVLISKFLKKWEVVAILSILTIMIPSFSAVYSLIYMSIPAMLFLDRKDINDDSSNILFIVLFVGMFILIPNISSFRISTLIETFCLFEMILLIEIKGVKMIIKNRVNKINSFSKEI